MLGLGNPQPAAPFTPSGNPIWDEIQQAHSQLSPAAQRAVTLSGVPQRASEAEAGPAPLGTLPTEAAPAAPATQPAAPLRPISGPASLNVRGLGSPAPAAPQPAPLANAPAAPLGQTPDAAAHLAERDRTIRTGSGIHQIRNPFLKGLATVGDVIGSAVLPNVMRAIPGTELHHRDVVGANESVVNADVARAKSEADRQEAAARAQSLLNPPEKNAMHVVGPGSSLVNNSGTAVYTGARTEPSKLEQDSAGHFVLIGSDGVPKPVVYQDGRPLQGKVTPGQVVKDAAGGYHRVNADNTATPITEDGKPLQGQAGASATETAKEGFQASLAKVAGEGLLPADASTSIAVLAAAIDKSQVLSPEEKANAKAYIASNTTPAGQVEAGEKRAIAFGQYRPVTVRDESNPDNVRYETAGAAIRSGASSPASIDFQTGKAVARAFAAGTPGAQLTAINTARYHMGTFKRLAEALNNNDVQGINNVKNLWKQQFGDEAPTNFNLAKEAFTSEVGRAFAVTNVTEGERLRVAEAVNRSESWSQLLGAANTADELLSGKQAALKQQHDAGRKGGAYFGDQTQGAGGAEQWVRDTTGKLVKK